MAGKPPRLVLERECKIHTLLPGWREDERLEASGVLALGDGSCLVVFDNLNRVARLDVSLTDPGSTRLIDAPGPGAGYEDIARDAERGGYFLLVEALRDPGGASRGRVVELDARLEYRSSSALDFEFRCQNRGFEGLVHRREDGEEVLWALCEGHLCRDETKGGGRVQVFSRTDGGAWRHARELALPGSLPFEDFSAIAITGDRVAITSQRSARLWCGRLDAAGGFVDEGRVYRFPKGGRYCNVEGISWLDENRFVAVSDRKKRSQPDGCADRDQSIHVFRLPDAED